MLQKFAFCLGLAAIATSASPASAGLVMGSMEVRSVTQQTINVPSGSPLTSPGYGVPPGEYVIDALGSFTATWGAEIGDTKKADVTKFSASYDGANGPFGP